MKKHFFKSTEADFQKSSSIKSSDLDILKKNLLYCTYRIDLILKLLQDAKTDKGLQKQVDEYFDGESQPNTPPIGDLD